MNKRIACCIPFKPNMPPGLLHRAFYLASFIPAANPTLDVTLIFDGSPVAKKDTDYTAWSRVTRIRNDMIVKHNLGLMYDYVGWIDADVVEYEPDIFTKLISVNPDGITAPMVYVEQSKRFYDWAAFIIKDASFDDPNNPSQIPGRNLAHEEPYWPQQPLEQLVQMDSVGTFYVMPAWLYTAGYTHKDHPSYTDHWEICAACRVTKHDVIIDRRLSVYHADLSKWGGWHTTESVLKE